MENYVLSKSTFMRGLQCAKSLYLYKNFYRLKDEPSAEQKALFSRGTDIGLLAHELFPGGIDASPATRFEYAQSVEKTKELIASGTKIIYEAAFIYQGVLAAIDMLVNHEGRWRAYEVKSATKISNTYLLDASLQYYVINGCGLNLEDIYIVNINNQYILQHQFEAAKFFQFTSVKEEVLKNQEMVKDKVSDSRNVLAEGIIPDIAIGEQCFYPYKCDFMGHCWKNVPKGSVFEMTGINRQKQFEMYRSGIRTIEDIPPDDVLRKKQQQETKSGDTVYIDKDGIKKFLDSLHYPLYFLDFETFMPAIPIYHQSKPYQHIPFQYSLHYKENPNGTLKHFEFLAEAGEDPRQKFITQLLKDTEGEGSILAYNAVFERSVLNSLKSDFPNFAVPIEERVSRIKDLMLPFQDKLYYHPMMKGSHSIKNVLPALVPDLNYDNLSIGSGRVAMSAFENLQTETDLIKIAETREALLSYCLMDTFAMVKLLETLEEVVGG